MDTNNEQKRPSAFAGGTKVNFNENGTYSSGPRHQNQNDNTQTSQTQPNNTTYSNSSSVSSTSPFSQTNTNDFANNTTNSQPSINNYTNSTSNTQSYTDAYTNNTNSTNTNQQANIPSSNTVNDKNNGRINQTLHSSTFWKAFFGALIACVLAVIILLIINNVTGTKFGSTIIGGSGSEITQADDSETLAEAVANKCLPSVVAINVYSNSSNSRSSSSSLTLSSMGSGVILSADGYVITNQHVINGAAAIRVTANGELHDAELVGEDSSSDIAVIKIKNMSGLNAMQLGNSDTIKIGEWVMSIGSPFGLEQSVATGIVSATSRSQVVSESNSSSSSNSGTKVYPNLIQTDAAINPGNSGGALVDKNGKLIGINALITSSSGNYSGVGFAIPVNYAIDLARQIIDGKTPSHAQLGVSMTNVTESAAKQYGWSVTSGAYVNGVTQNGPADKAGIKVGDIITKVDDKTISSTSDLLLAVRGHNPGDKVTITYSRGGSTETCEVTLGSDEGQTQSNNQQKNSSKNNSGNSGNSDSDSDMEDIWKYFFGQ